MGGLCSEVAVVSSSLHDVELLSSPAYYGAHTHSDLVACIGVEQETSHIPHMGHNLAKDVRITAYNCGQMLCIDATLGKDVCLAAELIEIITTILLLYDEEYELALTTEEGVLVDIREVVRR